MCKSPFLGLLIFALFGLSCPSSLELLAVKPRIILRKGAPQLPFGCPSDCTASLGCNLQNVQIPVLRLLIFALFGLSRPNSLELLAVKPLIILRRGAPQLPFGCLSDCTASLGCNLQNVQIPVLY